MPLETSAPDPIPDAEPQRKPPRRLWLYAPFVVVALLLVGWGGYWFVVKGRLEAGLDRQAEALRGAGYTVDMGQRRVEGFPFRIKLALGEARIATPSGWGLAVPGLEAEAYLHAPDHWVLVAPQGLTVTRPEGGGLAVKGQALRASVAGTAKVPWRIVLEGTKLVFTPAPGARPFSLASAERLEWYLRPTPDGAEGMTLLRLEGGKAAPQTLLHGIAGDAAVTGSFDARLSRPEAFVGKDWATAVQAWSTVGGVATVVGINAAGGKAALTAKEGTLGVGADGRLVGAIPLELKQAAPALAALAEKQAIDPAAAGSAATVAAARAQGEAARLNLVFQAGATTLGPVRIGPAPKVG